MRVIKLFFAIVMLIVSFACLIFAITAFTDTDTGNGMGIFCLVITGITLFIGINVLKIAKIKHEPKAASENSLIISYEDQKGIITERTIEIDKVYKKGNFLYVDAYCFLSGDNRTFRVDRILTMKDRFNENAIDDIESFLFEKYKKN